MFIVSLPNGAMERGCDGAMVQSGGQWSEVRPVGPSNGTAKPSHWTVALSQRRTLEPHEFQKSSCALNFSNRPCRICSGRSQADPYVVFSASVGLALNML